jgi:hypothetical protein
LLDPGKRCVSKRALSEQQALPIRGHAPRRPGHRLIHWVVMLRRQVWPRKELSGAVVIEPAFPTLEACDNRVAAALMVLRCMLTRRIIATANVSAFGTAAEVQPPAAGFQALDAAGPARLSLWIDTVHLNVHGICAIFSARRSRPIRRIRHHHFRSKRQPRSRNFA